MEGHRLHSQFEECIFFVLVFRDNFRKLYLQKWLAEHYPQVVGDDCLNLIELSALKNNCLFNKASTNRVHWHLTLSMLTWAFAQKIQYDMRSLCSDEEIENRISVRKQGIFVIEKKRKQKIGIVKWYKR